MYSLVLGCRWMIAQASAVHLNRRWLPSFSRGCLASRTIPLHDCSSRSAHSMRVISASRRADSMANSRMSHIGISDRWSRRAKKSNSASSSCAVGRRSRFRDFLISRNSLQAVRASWTISGLTGISLTLFAWRYGCWPYTAFRTSFSERECAPSGSSKCYERFS